jgi:hypothetical protein
MTAKYYKLFTNDIWRSFLNMYLVFHVIHTYTKFQSLNLSAKIEQLEFRLIWDGLNDSFTESGINYDQSCIT